MDGRKNSFKGGFGLLGEHFGDMSNTTGYRKRMDRGYVEVQSMEKEKEGGIHGELEGHQKEETKS